MELVHVALMLGVWGVAIASVLSKQVNGSFLLMSFITAIVFSICIL